MYGIIYRKGPKFIQAKRQIDGYKCTDTLNNFNKSVDFDTQWFIENILEQPCYYCGHTGFQKMTADRIDNTKGHYKENIVPACKFCNSGRSNRFTVEEYKEKKQKDMLFDKKINYLRNFLEK